MSQIKITYKEAKKYSYEFKLIESKVRKSKSKHKNDAMNTFDWHIKWAEAIKPNSTEAISWLVAQKGKCYASSDTLASLPKQVQNELDIRAKAIKTQQDKWSQLNHIQKVQKVNDLLKQLALGKGFIAVNKK